MDLAFRAFEAGNAVEARRLLEKYSRTEIQPDPRGWEWRYLWGQTREASALLGHHEKAVVFFEFSPDGRILATISQGATLKLWDVTTRRDLLSTNVHGDVLACVAWAPDGRKFATGGFDGTVKFWDAATFRIETTLTVPEKQERVLQVAFSPDGKVLASVGHSAGAIRFWDVEKRQELKRLPREWPFGPKQVAFSPDNRTMAVGTYGPDITLWDWQAGREIGTFEVGKNVRVWEDQINDVEFSPDGRMLAAAGRSIACTVWDVSTRRPLAVLTNHQGWVESACFSPDGRTLATGGYGDHRVRLWDTATWKELSSVTDFSGRPRARFSPKGDLLATAPEDGSVKLWALPLKRPGLETHQLGQRMGWARIAPEQHLLEFGTLNDTWHLWDLRTRREIYVLRPDTNVLSWTFLPSGMKLLEYTREMKLQFRHLPGGEVEPFLAHDFGEGANVELEASSDGRVILGVTRADVRVWDMPTKTQTYNFQPTDLKNWDGFALSPDNKSVFARVGPRLSVWQLDTLENSVLGGHRILVNSWGFLRDGHRFTSTSEEGTVMLRDFRDSREPLVFNCGLGGCSFVSLSWDEKRLVLPTWAGVIQLWDVASNRQIAALRACNYRQLVCAAAFLDENTLASVFDDELRLWRAPSWAEIEREEATRASVAPTKEEWK